MDHRLYRQIHPILPLPERNYLYFIDERFDIDEASFIKKQIEMSIPLDKEGHIYFDDEKVIVERRDSQNKTFFTFSPAYGRVWFAETFNKIRPDPQRGNWLAHYEIPKTLTDEDKARKDVRLDDIELGNKETSGRAIDVPRYQDETDAQYYKRMDDLHWR